MSSRKCDNKGDVKPVKDGKECENGHFICKDCIYEGIGFLGFGSVMKYCPLCGTTLR